MDLDWLDEYNRHRSAVIDAANLASDGYNDAIYDALKWFNSLKPPQKADVFMYMAGELWRRDG